MRSVDLIRQKLKSLFDRYEKEEFDLVGELMAEAGYKETEIKKEGISKNFSSSYFFLFMRRAL